MAEEHLRGRGIAPEDWAGRRFRWSENLDGGMWASVVIEVERRGGQWIVVRLDRSKETVAEMGFQAL